MRDTRLMFYSDDVERMNRILRDFVKLSGAKTNILIDKEGHPITQVGQAPSVDIDTLSALVAAAFMATREMARILGEEEFSILSHQGRNDHIQLTLIADRCILTTLFDESTNLGMIRLYSREAREKLKLVFDEMASRPDDHAPEELDLGTEEDAQSALDDVFG
jgi:predicted regulator of Ras-like GTPase activity (Roadblock/LC7/MglB family)